MIVFYFVDTTEYDFHKCAVDFKNLFKRKEYMVGKWNSLMRPTLQVGEENGKAKAAPLKMKIQFMLQVPQDDIKSSALMFRVKKRWDI